MSLPKAFFRDQEYQKLGKKFLSYVVVYFVVIQSNYGSTYLLQVLSRTVIFLQPYFG